MKHLLNLLDMIIGTGNFIFEECLNDIFALLFHGNLLVWVDSLADSFLLGVIFMIGHVLLLIIILRIVLSDHVVTLAKIDIRTLIIPIEGIEFFSSITTDLEGFTLHEIYRILFNLFLSNVLNYYVQVLCRELYELESRALLSLP